MSLIKSTTKIASSVLVLALLCYSSITSARFLSADPMSVGEHVQRYQDNLRRPAASAWHPPLEINPYAAVANNPLRWVDPTGFATVAPESGGGPFNQVYYPPDYVGSNPDPLGVLKHMGKTLGAIIGVPALIGTVGATASIAGEACLTTAARNAVKIKDICKNPTLAAILGATICTHGAEGKPPGSARQYPEQSRRIEEIRRYPTEVLRRNTGGIRDR
jgi:hypothetical protein